jgi:RNA polymerase sigma factor (sigma-70 family)
MEKKLTAEERKDNRNNELCRLIRENDLEAETRLLMENEGLVIRVAYSVQTRRNINSSDGIDQDDLMQEGRIALLTAAKTYDESRNAKFSTYAYEIIKNAMMDLCDYGQSSFERHMEDMGLTRLFLDAADPRTNESVLCGGGTDVEWHDPTGNLAVLHVMLEKMRNRLITLPERMRRLLAYHYGLTSGEAKSISESAAYFHLTEKYLRAIERHTLVILRDMMNDGKIV